MPALASTSSLNNSESVTAINANARIDYILRFSKQVVAVIDEEEQGYADISSQFLSSLPEQHNAAYLAMSPKLNDIQVRCRIIEQLFADTPFDPELSLANSIINLASTKKSPISIVIENGQSLSLQLTHELCQLVEIAKKSKLTVDVVLCGSVDMGRLIANNAVLFSQKVSMVSAQSGQLLSASSPLFKIRKTMPSLKGYGKYFIGLVILLALGAAVIYYLYQRDTMEYSQLATDIKQTEIAEEAFVINADEANLSKQVTEVQQEPVAVIDPKDAAANNTEIFSALMSMSEPSATPVIASSEDIVSALSAFNVAQEQSAEVAVADESVSATTNHALTELASGSAYFEQFDAGFVVQYITVKEGSDNQSLLNQLETSYSALAFHQYQRLINDEKYQVITSAVFTNREAAKLLIESLPQELAANGPWIKSIAAVKAEILQFKSSQ